MKDLKELLEKNRAWSEGIKAHDPDFFSALANQQSPRHLWIGRPDGRVPATQLTRAYEEALRHSA